MKTESRVTGRYPVPWLRHYRKAALLSQRELAAKAGVTQQTVVRLEHGYHARPSTVRKLAAALNLDPTVLVHSEAEGVEPESGILREDEGQ